MRKLRWTSRRGVNLPTAAGEDVFLHGPGAESQHAAFSRVPGTGAPSHGATPMTVNILLQPMIALIAGVLILAIPRLLNYIVAIYLIIVGLTGLAPQLAQ
jgi:hypothetical protein